MYFKRALIIIVELFVFKNTLFHRAVIRKMSKNFKQYIGESCNEVLHDINVVDLVRLNFIILYLIISNRGGG